MAELGVFGVGVATADPELRHVGDGKTAVCTVNLAFNRSFRNKREEWQSEPCFLRCQVWGSRAEKMGEIVKKGRAIYVCGYMKQDSWEAKDGQKRVSYSITCRDFQLCEKNGKTKNEPQPENTSTAPVTTSAEIDNDDIPF
jgi:single-strand DNA-binding protein